MDKSKDELTAMLKDLRRNAAVQAEQRRRMLEGAEQLRDQINRKLGQIEILEALLKPDEPEGDQAKPAE